MCGMGSYTGRVNTVGRKDDFAFISVRTVERLDRGYDARISGLQRDLFLHVRDNRALPEPLILCEGNDITFELDFERRNREGSPLVYGAQLL